MITKKQRAVVGACEHCGSGENLESAHIHGRDRIQIIDLLLGTIDKGDAVEVDLKQFEEAFKLEHEPFEKAILVLCTACHRKYDSPAVRPKAPAQAETGMAEKRHPSGPGLVESDILPITLDPIDPSVFKDQLLERKGSGNYHFLQRWSNGDPSLDSQQIHRNVERLQKHQVPSEVQER